MIEHRGILGIAGQGEARHGGRGPREGAVAHPFVVDVDGAAFEVVGSSRGMADCPILYGLRQGVRDGSEPEVILTAELGVHIRQWLAQGDPGWVADHGLPLSHEDVDALRARLGLPSPTSKGIWWRSHVDEIVSSGVEAFAGRHGYAPFSVRDALRKMRLGRTRRPNDWWRTPSVLKILRSGHPASYIAAQLGIQESYANELRRRAAETAGAMSAKAAQYGRGDHPSISEPGMTVSN